MAIKIGLTSFAFLFPLIAIADPTAIQVPESLKSKPEVQALINEYSAIAAKNPICNEKKNFGLRTFKVDGQPTVRYYVDGKGVACIPSRLRPPEVWQVTRDGWSEELLKDYQTFIYNIGLAVERGKCATVDTCMIGSTNPLRTATDAAAYHYADCADFPYFLRAYFSFRKGLPYSFASKMMSRPLEPDDQRKVDEVEQRINDLLENQRGGRTLSTAENLELQALQKKRKLFYDPRYSLNGNWVADRSWVMPSSQVSFFRWIRGTQDVTSTASMRVWKNEGQSGSDSRGADFEEQEPDFYSPALTVKAIVPGTVIYKHDGHTGVVYKIDYDNADPSQAGKIYYIDAHPDNTISWGVVDENWTRNMAGKGNLGGGFKNFRPITYERDFWGNRGEPRMANDNQMEKGYFSEEQYQLFQDPSAQVMFNDYGLRARVDYIDFLRLRMSQGKYRVNPASQFRDDLKRICTNMQYRREAVDEALLKGFDLLPHPDRLPDNIYGADGDWEKYSTPGRDVSFKQRIQNLISSLKKYKTMITNKHPLITQGLTLDAMKADLLQAWNQASASCMIGYRASDGSERSFNLAEAIRRVPYMSFDPYHCPERRFGATEAEELATCTDTADKAEWYTYEQFLRNHADKINSDPMGWSLPELKAMNKTQIDSNLLNRLDIAKAIKNL